jgi:hypothetical protein
MSSSKPRSFFYHFNRIGMQRGQPDIWTVHANGRCIPCRSVDCQVPTKTIYKGDTARQPRAIVKGMGIVTRKRNGVVVIK